MVGAAAEADRYDDAEMFGDRDMDLFPWWPVDSDGRPQLSDIDPAAAMGMIYHSQTRLPGGQLSMIVDPGAWTNLIGADLAAQLARRATEAGHSPRQVPMDQPLNIQGVGNGTQQCTHQLVTPIAVHDSEGRATLHSLTAPVVQGGGRQLPGLLGLRSLESLGAVLDMGRQQLIMPGGGDRPHEWPSGTTIIPLQKAPSGHLVLVIDEFERAMACRNGAGLPERSLQLHAQTGESDTDAEGTMGASSSAAAAERANFGAQ